MIRDYFDQAYLINLPQREDRRVQSLKECEKQGFVPQIFPAVDGVKENIGYHNPLSIPDLQWNSGAAGLNLTTIRLLEEAKRKGYKSVLIMEDDIEFHPQINEVVDACFHEIPNDWETIQFGCMHRRVPYKVTNRIFRIQTADCLHCYAVRDTAYDRMIEEIAKMELPLDWVTQYKIQPRGRSYCLMPNFAYQRPSFSNIAQMNVSYTFLK